MQELETLLNTLIARGGKPFNLNGVTKCEIADHGIYFYEGERSVEFCSYRELVSLESGLWQFVCENKLVKQSQKQRVLNPTFGPEGADCDWSIQSNDFQYRLIESALVPEEELAQFLVENIKTE